MNTEDRIRRFPTGATRDTEDGKLDYEGFLAPRVLERYACYMHEHRVQPDGTMRASDNWQKGIPKDAYMKSLWRHFMEVWTCHREGVEGKRLEDALCAVMFNTMGYLFEVLGEKKKRRTPLVYIAGPYGSDPLANTARAVEAAVRLRDAGAAVIVPHLFGFADMQVPRENEYWLEWCLDIIRTARPDAVVVFDDGDSPGTEREVALAHELGVPVVHGVDEAVRRLRL
jgi:hypothetical protein